MKNVDMASDDSDALTAKDLLTIIGLFLWAALSSATLATSICLTVLQHHHTAWPAATAVSSFSLFFGWLILLLKIAAD
jgi:hypothetical protein